MDYFYIPEVGHKLNSWDLDYMEGLFSERRQELENTITNCQERENFSKDQRAILERTHGKNFFKVKTIIRECEQEIRKIDKISRKLKNQVHGIMV